MSDRGIIFSAPMVRALLEGRKTQTRRLIKPSRKQREWGADFSICPAAEIGAEWIAFEHPKGGPYTCVPVPHAPGDRLYVREAWSHTGQGVWDIAAARRTGKSGVIYSADGKIPGAKYWPSIHLPREFSRLTLSVKYVRVQRVQEISELDARAEGVELAALTGYWRDYGPASMPVGTAQESFRSLWDSLHTKPGETWADNPWIVASSFDVRLGNIDRTAHA